MGFDSPFTQSNYAKEAIVNTARRNLTEAISIVHQYNLWFVRWFFKSDFEKSMLHLKKCMLEIAPVCNDFKTGSFTQVMNCRQILMKAEGLIEKYKPEWRHDHRSDWR